MSYKATDTLTIVEGITNSTNYYGNLNNSVFECSSEINNFSNSGIILGGGGSKGKSGAHGLYISSEGTIENCNIIGPLLGGGGAGLNSSEDSGCGGPGGGGGGAGSGGKSVGGNGGSLIYTSPNGFQSDETGGGGGGGPGGNGGGGKYNGKNSKIGGSGFGPFGGGGGGSGGDPNAVESGASATVNGGGNGARGLVYKDLYEICGAGGGYGGGNSFYYDINKPYFNGGGGGGGGISGIGTNKNGHGGYGIQCDGKILNLNNYQGGTISTDPSSNYFYGPLFYAGKAPTNYTMFITSENQYGQLWCTGVTATTGSINFDVAFTEFFLPINKSTTYYNVIKFSTQSATRPLVFKGTVKNNPNYSWSLEDNSNKDGYDLKISSLNDFISLNSLFPSRGAEGDSLTINFSTDLILSIGDNIYVYFNNETNAITGTIFSIESNGTINASCTIPLGSGTVPITISSESISSDNSLDFTYTNTSTVSREIYFLASNEIIDKIYDVYKTKFLFTLTELKPKTVLNFSTTVTEGETQTIYKNCEFSFILKDSTNIQSLKSVQLKVTNNSKDYYLIYDPYATTGKVNTFIQYKVNDQNFTINFEYNYIYVKNKNPNPWYFVKDQTSIDENRLIRYYPDQNYISAIATLQSDPDTSDINLQNIATLGMCGASNAFLQGPSPTTQDTLNASIAWCFYSLYNYTAGFQL